MGADPLTEPMVAARAVTVLRLFFPDLAERRGSDR